jgi:replicative DNA helicase
MIGSRTAIDAAAEVIGPKGDLFYRTSHGVIYTAAIELDQEGEPVDAITLADRLDQQGKLEGVGGRQRIHELAAFTPSPTTVAAYAQIVKDLATLRRIIRVGGEISQSAWDRAGTIPELIDRAEQEVFTLGQEQQRPDMPRVADTLRDTIGRIEDAYRQGRAVVGVPTGLTLIDRVTSGFQPGNLVVVAARPSMGKTGLILTIAGYITMQAELPVAVFSLEMSTDEVTQRMLSLEGLVDSTRIRNGQLDAEQWRRVHTAAERLNAAPLYVEDNPSMKMQDIRSKARRLKLKHPNLALVVVDYLQLMTQDVPTESRVQEVGQISRALKVLARELAVPVIAVSQLSRQPESRHDKRPILSDLRESGAIEQDADIVAFIYRDEYYNPEQAAEDGTEGIAEVAFAKHRNGETTTVKLAFVKKYAKFDDLAPDL